MAKLSFREVEQETREQNFDTFAPRQKKQKVKKSKRQFRDE